MNALYRELANSQAQDSGTQSAKEVAEDYLKQGLTKDLIQVAADGFIVAGVGLDAYQATREERDALALAYNIIGKLKARGNSADYARFRTRIRSEWGVL